MTKFCGCNSEWYIYKGHEFADDSAIMAYELCSRCQYYKWYDPHYENMMFDLKRMNE